MTARPMRMRTSPLHTTLPWAVDCTSVAPDGTETPVTYWFALVPARSAFIAGNRGARNEPSPGEAL